MCYVLKKSMKKLYLAILIFIVIAAIFLRKEIKNTANITIKKETVPIISKNLTAVPIDKNDPIYGNPGAPITIIEFADLGCKKCYEIHKIVTDIVVKNPEKVRLIWKNLPTEKWFSAPNTLPLESAYCASEQNKFWQFVNTAMQSKKSLQADNIKKIAEGLKLDTDKWWKCVQAEKTKQKISSSVNTAKQLGIKTAPTIFVNNKWINIEEDFDLKELLEQFVKE